MSLKNSIMRQFRNPQGVLGQFAGYIMAHRPSNVERNLWTINLLDLKSTDRLLEIGFGPGLAIEAASKLVTDGLIIGVDHSEIMLHQATKRNYAAIEQGRVELYLGRVDILLTLNKPFNKICSANVVQFWPDPTETFLQLKKLLVPGGVIATTYMPRHSGATNTDGQNKAHVIEQQLKAAGFSQIRIETLIMEPINAYSVVAVNDE